MGFASKCRIFLLPEKIFDMRLIFLDHVTYLSTMLRDGGLCCNALQMLIFIATDCINGSWWLLKIQTLYQLICSSKWNNDISVSKKLSLYIVYFLYPSTWINTAIVVPWNHSRSNFKYHLGWTALHFTQISNVALLCTANVFYNSWLRSTPMESSVQSL